MALCGRIGEAIKMSEPLYKIGDLVKSVHTSGLLGLRGLGIIVERTDERHRFYRTGIRRAYKIHWAGLGKATWESEKLITKAQE